jgi:hypothetical protein
MGISMSTPREQEQYRIGLRNGIRLAITWLHNEAKKMNDPHAVALLNTKAFHLGVDLSQGRIARHHPPRLAGGCSECLSAS